MCSGLRRAGKEHFRSGWRSSPAVCKGFQTGAREDEDPVREAGISRWLPDRETGQKVYDELDLQRATQLYLDMYPALSMRGMMIGTARDYGAKNSSDISVTADRLDSKAMWLTGNTESIYAMIVFDLKVDGPTVFEAPRRIDGTCG